MLIAAANLAVALAVSPAGEPAVPPVSPMPPMIVIVSAASDLSPRMLSLLLAETDAIWRAIGVRFLWQWEGAASSVVRGRISSERPYGSPSLRVVIGHEPHAVQDRRYALGWIMFDDPATPEQEIHISYDNAISLLEQSPGVVGVLQNMPLLQREILLGRAMGRALAHELGHYLSASKAHAPKGLMMAVHTAAEFFGPDRERFTLDLEERQRIVARFTSIYMASRG